ncbi:hypothetical protein [Methanopyrus sp.]
MSKSSPEEALEEAAEDLDRIDVVLCAFSPRHDPHEVRKTLVEYLDCDCLILGLSSAGNITTDGSATDRWLYWRWSCPSSWPSEWRSARTSLRTRIESRGRL